VPVKGQSTQGSVPTDNAAHSRRSSMTIHEAACMGHGRIRGAGDTLARPSDRLIIIVSAHQFGLASAHATISPALLSPASMSNNGQLSTDYCSDILSTALRFHSRMHRLTDRRKHYQSCLFQARSMRHLSQLCTRKLSLFVKILHVIFDF